MIIFLGTQSYGSLAKPLDQPGCKLEIPNKQPDRWGPLVRERERISLRFKMEEGACTRLISFKLCWVPLTY